MIINAFALPPIFSLIIAAMLGIYVFRQNTSLRINISFALFCLTITVWLSGYSCMYLSEDADLALTFARIGYMGIAFIPVLNYHFTFDFLKLNKPFHKTLLVFSYAFGATCLLLVPTNYIYNGIQKHFWGYYPTAGKFYIYWCTFFVAIWTYGLWLLVLETVTTRKSGQAVRSNQVKFVLIAFGAGSIGLVDFLPKYGINIYPFAYACSVTFMAVIAYAIVAHRLMDITELTRDALIHTGTSILLAGTFIVAGGLLIPHYPMAVYVIAVVMLVFAVPNFHNWLSKRLAPAVDQAVFRGRFDYQKKIQEIGDNIFSIYDMNELLETLVQNMVKALNIGVSCIYIAEKRTDNFELWAHTGLEEETAREYKMLVAGAPFVKVLHKESKIILREDLLKHVRDIRPGSQDLGKLDSRLQIAGMTKGGLAGAANRGLAGMTAEQKSKSELEEDVMYKNAVVEMEELGCEIVVPLYFAEKIIGVIMLGPKKNKNMYTHKDIGLLEGLGRDVSHMLGFVTVIYDQAQVVAATAHDAKQPLSGARMSVQNLLIGYFGALNEKQRFELNYTLKRIDFINNFMMDLVEMNDILRRTLRGEYKFESYDLEEALEDVVGTLRPVAEDKGLKLSFLCSEHLPHGLGVSGSIMRAFSNLVSNSIKFTESGFVEVSASSDGQCLEVKVTDTGPGMNEKELKNLFLPFSRIVGQKKNPMDSFGLGLTVVKEVVDIHKGNIKVESEPGEGTVFTVRLPVKGAKIEKESQEVICHGK